MNCKVSIVMSIFIFVPSFMMISEISYLPLIQRVINSSAINCTSVKQMTGNDYKSLKSVTALEIPNTILIHVANNKKLFYYPFNEAYHKITKSPYFNNSLPTVFFIHGYFGGIFLNNYINIMKGLRRLGNVNIFFLDYGNLVIGSYYKSSTNVQIMGEALGKLLAKLYINGHGNFHLIGHSLGSHLSGFAGKIFKQLTSVGLRRISGLDPAAPCYYYEPSTRRLTSTDADFVDIIHTDVNQLGIIDPLGHVDFYPNNGRFMPGCELPLCSHLISGEYYGESIIYDKFVAVQCSDWETFLKGGCINNNKVNMGYWVSTAARGIYFLQTNTISPYAMGNTSLTG